MPHQAAKLKRRVAWSIGVLAAILLIAWLGLLSLRQPHSSAATRGWRLAGRLGCFSCHNPEGVGGIANPGSEEEETPAWDGGMLIMYVDKEEEIAEWILYGRPRRLQADHQHSSSEHGGLIEMPAFQERISQAELEDLVALVKAIGAYGQPTLPSQAREGFEAARRLGCFGCHRVGGRVGTPNPGSFKDYIPPWQGEDFEDLVRTEAELREWILEGRIQRLEANPLARYFTARQIIQMPAYRPHLQSGDLEALIAYIDWLRSLPAAPSPGPKR